MGEQKTKKLGSTKYILWHYGIKKKELGENQQERGLKDNVIKVKMNLG